MTTVLLFSVLFVVTFKTLRTVGEQLSDR